MRRLISFLSLIVIPFIHLNSQEVTYNKHYNLGGLDGSLSVTISENNNPVVLGSAFNANGTSINLLFLDKYGNLSKNLEFWDSTYAYYQGWSNSLHIQGNRAVVCGEMSNYKTNNSMAVLYDFDLTNETLEVIKFSDTTRTEFRSLQPTFDGGFIALGSTVRANGNDEVLLVKYNNQLQEEWIKTYGDGFNDEIGFFVEQLQDSTYLLSGAKEVNNYLVHVNDTGKVLSWEVYHANYGGCLTVQSKDSNYLMRTTEQIYFPSLPGLGSIHTLRKINATNNQVIWESQMFSGYQGEFSSRPIEVENGNIYVAGFQIQEWDTLGNGNVVGRLACFSPDGDSLWSRTYLVDSIGSNYIYDMARTEDGYFVMTGSAHGWDQDVWVLKVDSNGCVVEGCGKPSVQEVDDTMGSFFMYPNPTKNQLHLSLYKQATELKLFNLQGQLVLNQSIPKGARQLNFQLELPKGLYLVQVLNNGRVLGQEKLVVE